MFTVKQYKEFLEFKLKSAEYHFRRCRFLLGYAKGYTEEQQLIAVSSEFTAMALAYHSALDILAQLLNKYGSLNIKEKDVTFYKIYTNRNRFNKDIKYNLEDLYRESRYLNDFCNTIKHRSLIAISDKRYLLDNTPIKLFVVSEFKRNKSEYPSYFVNTISKRIHKNISTLIIKILSQAT